MIKALIFDFGDVFLNLDKAATSRELKRLKIPEFTDHLLGLNEEYEKGLLTSEEFIAAYQREFQHLEPHDFTKSWNAILLDFPQYRLNFLKELAREGKYKLILLSNTNNIHIDWVKENIPFFEEFKNCFDAFYLSQEINLRKPDASIYEFVLHKHHLMPHEALFIDDTPANTEAAAKIGIHTWNINPAEEDVTDLFRIKKELF